MLPPILSILYFVFALQNTHDNKMRNTHIRNIWKIPEIVRTREIPQTIDKNE